MNDRATIVVSARTGEIVLCLVFAALAGYVMFAASRMPMGSYTLPGPGVFPLALGVMLAVASLARVAWHFARPRLERDTVALALPTRRRTSGTRRARSSRGRRRFASSVTSSCPTAAARGSGAAGSR